MSEGWIKLHRKIIQNPLFADVPPEWLRVAIFILLSVNREQKKWYDGRTNVTIPAGSFVTSLGGLAKTCKVGVQVVRGALSYLENSGFITRSTTNRHTMLTVTKWNVYQSNEQSDNTVDNKPATSGQQTSNKPATTTKEVKEVKEEVHGTNGQTPLFELSAETNPEAFDPDEFFNEKFWPVIWKKVGVGAARVAFRKWATTPELADRITQAAIAQGPEIMARASKSTNGNPILASSWLNGERFNDEMTEIGTGAEVRTAEPELTAAEMAEWELEQARDITANPDSSEVDRKWATALLAGEGAKT